MIISASRRTDIPTYYSEWFFNRIKEGYVLVRNPMNIHKVGKISLLPEVVDGIIFWTKNPTPMIDRLDELNKYVYYFQFTLNSYGEDVEPNVPSKSDIILPIFRKLSQRIGKDRVIWRYDPIFVNEKYTIDYHCKYFKALSSKLVGYTDKCTLSFIDLYTNTERNIRPLRIIDLSDDQKIELIQRFSEIAKDCGLKIDTCAETLNLEKYGIGKAQCIDKLRLEHIGDYKLEVDKDKNQREACGCIASMDIGMYNTCKNGCLYCYANHNQQIAQKNYDLHNPHSPLISGEINVNDEIKVRETKSCKDCQLSFLKNK